MKVVRKRATQQFESRVGFEVKGPCARTARRGSYLFDFGSAKAEEVGSS